MSRIPLLDELLKPETPLWQQVTLGKIRSPYAKEILRESWKPPEPESPVRAGVMRQFGYGIRDLPVGVYNRISQTVTGSDERNIRQGSGAVTTGEHIARLLGSLTSAAVMFSLAPIAIPVKAAATGIAAMVAPVVAKFGLSSMAAGKIGAAMTSKGVLGAIATKYGTGTAVGAYSLGKGIAGGAAIGGLRAYSEERDVLAGAKAGAAWGGGLSAIGVGLKSAQFAGLKASLAEKISGRGPMDIKGMQDAQMHTLLKGTHDERSRIFLERAFDRLKQHQHLMPAKIKQQLGDILNDTDKHGGQRLADAMKIAKDGNVHSKLVFRDTVGEIRKIVAAKDLLAKGGGKGHDILNRLFKAAPGSDFELEYFGKQGIFKATQVGKKGIKYNSLDSQLSRLKKLKEQTLKQHDKSVGDIKKQIDNLTTHGIKSDSFKVRAMQIKIEEYNHMHSLKMASLQKAEGEFDHKIADLFNISRRQMPMGLPSDWAGSSFQKMQTDLADIYNQTHPSKIMVPHESMMAFLAKHSKAGGWTTPESVRQQLTKHYGAKVVQEFDDLTAQISGLSQAQEFAVGTWVQSILKDAVADLPQTGKVPITHVRDLSIIDLYDIVAPGGGVSFIRPTRRVLGSFISDQLRRVDIVTKTASTELSSVINPHFKPLMPGAGAKAAVQAAFKQQRADVIRLVEATGNKALLDAPMLNISDPSKFVPWKSLTDVQKAAVKALGVGTKNSATNLPFLKADASEQEVMKFADTLRAAQASRFVLDRFGEMMNVENKSEWLDSYFPHILRRASKAKTPAAIGKLAQEVRMGPKVSKGVKVGVGPDGKPIRMWASYIPRQEDPSTFYEMDAYESLRRYIKGGLRIKYLAPTTEALKPLVNKMDTMKQAYYNKTVEYLGDQPGQGAVHLSNMLKGVAGLFGKDMTPDSIRSFSNFMTSLQYHGTIWANPFSAVKNLTQQTLAVFQLDNDPSVGLKYWSKTKQLAGTPFGEWVKSINPVLGSRQYVEGLRLQHDLMSKLPTPVENMSKMGFSMFRASDRANVHTSFMMGLLYNVDKGIPITQAIDEATAFTMATQFMYGFDSPQLFKDEVGRQMGILTSWPINWMEGLMQKATTPGERMQVATTVAGMALAAEALSLTGISFRSIYPTEVLNRHIFVSMATDEDQWPALPKVLAQGTNVLLAKLRDEDPQIVDEAIRKFLKSFTAFIPAGVQYERFRRFSEAVRNEYTVYDKQMRTRHKMTDGGILSKITGVPGEALRGILGPTTEGYERSQQLDLANHLIQTYRRNRLHAVDAYIEGNYKKFQKYQDLLTENYGAPVGKDDIDAELQLREKHALLRRLQGLPKDSREAVLETLGHEVMRDTPVQSVLKRRLAKYGIEWDY